LLSQFTEVRRHFCELKTKPCKGFESTKWLRHFVLWNLRLVHRQRKSKTTAFFADRIIDPDPTIMGSNNAAT